MKINFGSGAHPIPGHTNIDAVTSRGGRAPQIVYAMEFDGRKLRYPIPLASGSADELVAFHVIEHFYAWEADAVVVEWARLLRSGGRLILELPNLALAAQNLLTGKGDALTMFPLYGDPSHIDPFMCHKWGYTPSTIEALLTRCGLRRVVFCEPKTHGQRVNRDMRVEAVR